MPLFTVSDSLITITVPAWSGKKYERKKKKFCKCDLFYKYKNVFVVLIY